MTARWFVDSLQRLHTVEAVAPSALQPAAAVPSVPVLFAQIQCWEQDFVAGQAPATIAAVRADWQQYLAWCQTHGHTPLPAGIEQLTAFINNALLRGRKRTTLKRYVYTVGLIHDVAGLPNPSRDLRWKSKWKAIVNALAKRVGPDGDVHNGNKTKHAGELIKDDIDAILATLGTHLRDLRDAAMLALASDSMVRESELVRVRVEHLHYNRTNARWALYVPATKANRAGIHDEYRHVDAATIERIRAWQDAAGITNGVLFRPIGGRPRSASKTDIADGGESPVVALMPREVARIFRRRAIAAGLPHAGMISGHSTRIGTANDLINNGATTAQIQHAGGWASAEMVNLYTGRAQAGENAVASLRRRQRVNQPDA